MAKKRGRKPEIQEQREAEQVLALNPLTSAERLLSQLSNACDESMVRVNKADSDAVLNRALLQAGECFRKHYAFGNELSKVTGKAVYRPRWQFAQRLTEYQKRRWLSLKHSPSMPIAAEMPGREILDALRQQTEPPVIDRSKIFESEGEYQRYLQENGLTEAHAGYLPETTMERRQRYGE
jgi:hypothetical protein